MLDGDLPPEALDDLDAVEQVAAGIRQLLPPGSTARAYTSDGLNAALAEKCGIERLFFYEFRSKERDPFYSEDHFGLTHRDLSPKPAYERLKARASAGARH